MDHLAKLITSASPGPGIQFRKQPYGAGNLRDFLRDAMALANASVEGPRYIVIGMDFDGQGRRQIHPVGDKDFSGKPAYRTLLRDHIEPPLKVNHEAVTVDGKQVGVFRIGDCRDRPYMMRVDFSEELRRGDAYMRVNESAIKMGRRQLQVLFEKKFQDSVSGNHIEVGFPGEIIHKHLLLGCQSLDELPSAVAASKLEQLIKIQLNSRNTGSTSIMARLVHARLFGSDDPYVSRSPDELMQEMEQIRHKYETQDREFLFETNAQRIQLVLYNQGHEPVVDASLVLVFPNDPDLFTAAYLSGARPARPQVRHSLFPAGPQPAHAGKRPAAPAVQLTGSVSSSTCRRVAPYSARTAVSGQPPSNLQAACAGSPGAGILRRWRDRGSSTGGRRIRRY